MSEPVACLVDGEVAAEFPGLKLWSQTVEAGEGPSPRELKARLRGMSSRVYGSVALELRQRPIPHAYRVFFRHIGLDPDVTRVPVEQLMLERLKDGGFKSRSLLGDALTIATMETHVPVWALDEDTLVGDLELRRATPHEPLGRGQEEYPVWLPEGRLVIADLLGPVAVLCGDLAAAHATRRATRRTRLFSIQVEGVPSIHVSEAFWTVQTIVEESAPQDPG